MKNRSDPFATEGSANRPNQVVARGKQSAVLAPANDLAGKTRGARLVTIRSKDIGQLGFLGRFNSCAQSGERRSILMRVTRGPKGKPPLSRVVWCEETPRSARIASKRYQPSSRNAIDLTEVSSQSTKAADASEAASRFQLRR